jgi:hypothetical protein
VQIPVVVEFVGPGYRASCRHPVVAQADGDTPAAARQALEALLREHVAGPFETVPVEASDDSADPWASATTAPEADRFDFADKGEGVTGKFVFSRYVMAVWLFFLGGAVSLAFGLGALLAGSDPNQGDFARLAVGVTGTAVAVALFGWCVVEYVGRTRWLGVNPQGLSWAVGGRTGSATWAEVREVYRDDSYQVATPHGRPSEWMRRAHVRVVLHSGVSVTFRQTLDRFDALAREIQARGAQAVLPAKLAELAATGEAKFGRVAVGPTGVKIGKKEFAWAEINYAGSEGWLCVAPARDEFNIEERKDIRLSEIPNYVALIAIMAAVGKPPVERGLLYPLSWRRRMGGRL